MTLQNEFVCFESRELVAKVERLSSGCFTGTLEFPDIATGSADPNHFLMDDSELLMPAAV